MKSSKVFSALLIVSFFVSGCGPESSLEVGYTPPFIPLRVSINSDGEVELSVSGAYVTPIGTFHLGGGYTIYSFRGESEYRDRRMLIIRLDNTVVVYELVEGEEFEIVFEGDGAPYTRVGLEYEPDGDIVLELESVDGALDVRVGAQAAVEEFQEARAVAYSTWNTDQYHEVLTGGALESALQTIGQLQDLGCHYYIEDDREMRFQFESVSGNRVTILASRDETQRRVCRGETSYTCYVFDGRYVVQQLNGQWYIVEKSVEGLIETSPCP